MYCFWSWTLTVYSIFFVNMNTYSILIVNVNTTLYSVNMSFTLYSLWTWTLLCTVFELLGGTTQALTSHCDVWFSLKSIPVSRQFFGSPVLSPFLHKSDHCLALVLLVFCWQFVKLSWLKMFAKYFFLKHHQQERC